MGLGYNYEKGSEFSAMAPARRAFDITPTPLDSNGEATLLNIYTRGIMVSVDATVTGIFVGDSAEHTTHTLTAGVFYPFAFKAITAVSSGTVKGYA